MISSGVESRVFSHVNNKCFFTMIPGDEKRVSIIGRMNHHVNGVAPIYKDPDTSKW